MADFKATLIKINSDLESLKEIQDSLDKTTEEFRLSLAKEIKLFKMKKKIIEGEIRKLEQ